MPSSFYGGRRMHKKCILQHDERDCGSACLAMVASHYGYKNNLSFFRKITSTDKWGTNILGIVEGASCIGLSAEALEGERKDLIDFINADELKFPFIAHIINQDGSYHFVTVLSYKRGNFTIADPGIGIYKVKEIDFFDVWTGHIVVFEPTENFKSGNFCSAKSLSMGKLIKKQKKILLNTFILSLFIVAIGMFGTFVFEVVIDGFATDIGYNTEPVHVHEHDEEGQEKKDDIEHKESDLSDELDRGAFLRFVDHVEIVLDKVAACFQMNSFNLLFVALLILYVFSTVVQFLRGKLIIMMSKNIDIELEESFFGHIMDMPVQSVLERQTGEYLSRFSDTAIIRAAVSSASVTIFLDSLMVIGCGIILFIENHTLSYISLIILFLYIFIAMIYKKPIEITNRHVMEQNAIVESYIKESVDGIEQIKANCAERVVKACMHNKIIRFIDSVVKNNLINVSQEALCESLEMIGMVFVLWVGFAMVLTNQLTMGSLMTFYALRAYFTEPVKNLISLQPQIQTAFVAVERLNDVLEIETQKEIDGAEPMPSLFETLKIENAVFEYSGRDFGLKNINLEINRGEKIAIVGESGSGKTTLAKLILRFVDPQKGTIKINGINIRTIDVEAYRKKIAYVSQNLFLFSDSIRNNLIMGQDCITDEMIYEACKVSQANHFIDKLPFGLDTVLEENGANLSGGQRQRLVLTQALLKQPEILIMDEVTSNLDYTTETAIHDAIYREYKDKTTIIIAHRLNTVIHCDKIIVMEEGKIVDQGTHKELMKRQKAYSRLWIHEDLQTG